MDKDNKPTPNLCSQGERIYTSPDQNSEVLLKAFCPIGQKLIEQELIQSFQRHLANCWTCAQAFYAPSPLPVSTDDLCPNAITLQAIYLIDPSPSHWRNYEYHLRECWHCRRALTESRTIGEILEYLQVENSEKEEIA